ncbi:MAG: FAD-dependent oxidoreductase, partial [Bacilli bacterium]
LLIDKEAPGGNLNKSFRVENYPGYVEHSGPDLAFKMYSQLEELGLNVKIEEVISVEKENTFKIITNKGKYESEYLIISSGRTAKKLLAENAKNFEGRGISYCAVCDGSLYKDRKVVIVGGGNTAAETAIYLSNIAKEITIINRSNELKCTDFEKEELLTIKNLIIKNGVVVEKVIDENNNIVAVSLSDDTKVKADGIFVCIGQALNDGFYHTLKLNTTSKGIIVNELMETSEKKVYACGDVIDKKLYQIVTATSEGAIAATSIINKLKRS